MEAFRVLIVDDVKSNLMVMKKCLQGLCEVIEANSGSECLDIAKVHPQPDLILLDVHMPDLNGYDVCRFLKEDPATETIPVIFVTGNDSDESEELGLQLGAIDYITKPIRPVIVRARVAVHMQLKQQRDKLRFMAMHDQLTGLFNRYFLVENAEVRLAHFRRHRTPLSVVLMDVDKFKSINDNYGHDTGDRVLVSVAELLKKNTRREDVVARLGGEEFVILMECPLASAAIKVERLRGQLEQLKPEGLNVTGCFGIVDARDELGDLSHLLKIADDCVYQGKSAGRNQVVIYQEPDDHSRELQLKGS